MIRLATYNIEWFNALFDENDQIRADGGWSARYNVTRLDQAEALAHVFRSVDPDAILIVEAPDTNRTRSTEAALLSFAKYAELRLDTVLTGFESETQQEIALLFDGSVFGASHDPQDSPEAPRFDESFRLDIDVDGADDQHVFSKPPLEAAVTVKGTGRLLRLIGVHVKSKAPHGARTEEEAIRISIANRRKQLAQCQWLRARVIGHLNAGDDLIVLGDFNDGPGLDEYEKLFGKSGIEVVMGPNEPHDMHLFDPHAAQHLAPRSAAAPASARFYDKTRKRYLNALLDFVLVSDRIHRGARPAWRIWHPFDDPDCFKNDMLRKALLTASDHFPVSIDLNL